VGNQIEMDISDIGFGCGFNPCRAQ